ncbi:hypothetical protein [Azomonas macrocytogenes]|uniref:Uncharacterized protein n=1 Tax=Azomonas macrocytogenes TaxID=69962 RepID=A0A839T3J0_AZOMA|nr:hypothetical protein [Azomonas macrocytogenes]MBB3102914.1 hypothetical protein [Azomonas macrocytogenes]
MDNAVGLSTERGANGPDLPGGKPLRGFSTLRAGWRFMRRWMS